MQTSMIRMLVKKDWSLMGRFLIAYLLVGVLAAGLLAWGTQDAFYVGSVLLVSVLMTLGVHLAMQTIVLERTEHTLVFVMSLPITMRQYTVGKLLANLLIYLLAWTLLLGCTLAVVAITEFLPNGLIPFTCVVFGMLLCTYIALLGVSLVSESQGWTIFAVVGTNLSFQYFLFWASHLPQLEQQMQGELVLWAGPVLLILVGQLVLCGLLLAITCALQERKTDFI